MDNILYLDDYINLYNRKLNKLIITKPYKKTLANGLVIDKFKFIKKYNTILEKYKLKNNFFNENITVIINNLYNKEDKELIINILEILDYKNIKFIQELDVLKLKKDDVLINANREYFYLLYTDYSGNYKINVYKNDLINRKVLSKILSILNKKNIFLYGKNRNELDNILKNKKLNVYIYEDSDNLVIFYLLNKKICQVESNH